MKQQAKGFSLIEVLVATVVVAMGLLAVATFQTSLMKESGTSKARSEALAIAQSYIDQMRNFTDGVPVLNYTSPVTDETAFNTVFANTGTTPANFTSGGANVTINGTNAVFTPTYQISSGTAAAPAKNLAINVAWTGTDGNTQSVTLTTKLGWAAPGAVADLANNDMTPLIPTPTGAAHLGEGTITNTAFNAINAANKIDYGNNAKSFDDGTDRKLIIFDTTPGVDTQQIVLTLKNACVSGVCSDFVKISGRVYIDKDAQSINPGDLYVKASDAAYCHRYYTNSSGSVITVSASTTMANTPDSRGTGNELYDGNGDYEYYDYTCYLGGGWHGNIGMVKAGGLQPGDLACLGDPRATAPAYARPVISNRRAYRAMVHKEIGGVPVEGNNGMVIYYSAGVADAKTINNQHFLFSKISGNPVNADCYDSDSPMKRPDATVGGVAGALFADMPDAFHCLNEDGPSYVDATLFNFNDTTTGYALDPHCPYDPTDPPTASNIVQGKIVITSSQNDANVGLALDDNISLDTSDAAGNCDYSAHFTYSGGAWSKDYECTVYHKGTGWSGYFLLTGTRINTNAPPVECTTRLINLLNITADYTSGTQYDFNTCYTGETRKIKGKVYVSGSPADILADLPSMIKVDDSVAGFNNCKFTSTNANPFTGNTTLYEAEYQCDEIDNGTGWTGSIFVTASTINSRSVTCDTRSYAGLTADASDQHLNCTVTTVRKISGVADSTANGKSLVGATVTPTGGTATACTITGSGADVNDRYYECSIQFVGTSSWSGILNFTVTNGAAACAGANTSATPKSFTITTPVDQTYNFTVKNGNC